MPTRRTPQDRPRRGSRRDQVQRNIRPGARGTERAVDHDAHGTVGGMRAQIDDALSEAIVADRGHRDQQLAGQERVHGICLGHTGKSGVIARAPQASWRAGVPAGRAGWA